MLTIFTGFLIPIIHAGFLNYYSLVFSFITSFFLLLFLGLFFVKFANRNFSARARIAVHKAKDGIPTMGGLLISFILLINFLWWLPINFLLVSGLLPVLIGFSVIGAIDDWYKITAKKGISASGKFFWQIIVAAIALMGPLYESLITFHLPIAQPFLLSIISHPVLTIVTVLWGLFTVIGYSNAVNLTDGLDGLAVQTLIPTFTAFMGMALVSVSLATPFASYCALAAAIICGALVGFWFYNRHPARIFMGDVGSLPLGALVGIFALLLHAEWLFLLAGSVLVLETVCVIIQMSSYAIRGKRLFYMAPLHHHFELMGWSEKCITRVATVISWIGSLSALLFFWWFQT